ncbi:hypothetical protein A1Q1_03238 [Trichosporon asahii var. asahii CBS 2479]|uniref:Intermediate filament protein n=1 Tax=Trichosporon asahii var. asahii (strain ATCC 90039 / CBS 2479 / JCM 2466 / KCTC 7840 / NBRC 103889/ NCYC 2677 / UAMH 7654) TaxID=1186058 RepID=J5SW72_TRIAS|nr:hypothetical protein A1Q1_03238 [Trichosporon asahii var. asahii CBS 2479]EJT47861.1 hypothetical protein A1Q1_03238 [Trichosporon asahii var. asahii CBS 2479]
MPRIRPAAWAALAVTIAVIGVLIKTDSLKILVLGPLVSTFCLSLGVCGLVLAANYLEQRSDAPSLTERQASATRPFALATDPQWSWYRNKRKLDNDPEPSFPPVHGFEEPKLAARLSTVLGLIRGSFILPWFSKISRAPAFPNKVEGVIRHALGEVSTRVETVDWPSLGVEKVLPLVTEHIAHYKNVEHLAGSIGTSDALPLPLPKDAHAAFTHHTHTSAESNIPAIEAHLRGHVERIVSAVVPLEEQSAVLTTIVREIVLGAILMPVFNLLSEPDFWNRQINEQGGKYLHQRWVAKGLHVLTLRKQVNQVLSALSTVPAPASGSSPAKPPVQPISVQSTPRQFEDFMRSITKLRTLGEARRLRSDIDREYRHARAAFRAASQRSKEDGADNDKAIRHIDRYLHRLERARGAIDHRIEKLSGVSADAIAAPAPSKNIKPTLYRILSDPSSLAYWLEFMERRGRSHLVQFWLTVEGFKDPLEASGQNLALDNVVEGGNRPGANDATIGDDIAFLYSAYFAESGGRLDIPARLVEVISELGQNTTRPFGAVDTRRAKLAVYQAQRAVYELMEEEDWSTFQKSDLYFKAVADLKHSHRPRANSGSTPPISTSNSTARLSPSGQRRVSDGPPISTPSPVASPLLARRPLLVNGSFMPAASSQTATPVTSNDFDSSMTSLRDAALDSGRASPRASPHSSTILSPGTKRHSAQFDILFGTQEEISERNPLFVDEEDQEEVVERQRIAAIQAALEEIIDSDPMSNSQVLEPETEPQTPAAPRSPLQGLHPLAARKKTSRSAEDLTSVRDVGPARPVTRYSPGTRRPRPARRGSDEGVHGRQKSIFAEDPEEDEEQEASTASDGEPDAETVLPAPGNLHLGSEIERLGRKLAELGEQERLLDSLIRQADLTGNARERRRTPRRQVRRGDLTGRRRTRADELDDHTPVQRVLRSGPCIARLGGRESESGHQGADRNACKRLVPSTSAGFVESRRAGLERYLQSLLGSALFCSSTLVQNFLSRGAPSTPSTSSAGPLAPRNLVRTLYKTVASSIDVELAPSMLDIMSQSLTRQLSEVAGGLGVVTEEVAGLIPFTGADDDDDAGDFAGPICDAFLEVFDLKERDWLRRQAIVLLLQQVLGSTVERKVRDLVGKASQPKKIEKLLAAFQENMWPGGKRKEPSPKRTPEEIRETRLSASRKLGRLLPDVLANVVGRSNARKAAQRTFAVIQDQRLNQHLWVRVLDEILYTLFPLGGASGAGASGGSGGSTAVQTPRAQ